MKQKMVINVPMNGPKSQSRALKIVVGISGVESAQLGEKDKGQIVVVGDGVDAVKLTNLLRKRMEKRKIGRCWLGSSVHAELLSVNNVEEKKEEKKEEPPQQAVFVGGGGVPHHLPNFLCEVIYGYDDRYPACSIL